MRFPGVTLLVVFILLSWVATAGAECAWVLWTETTTFHGPDSFPDTLDPRGQKGGT